MLKRKAGRTEERKEGREGGRERKKEGSLMIYLKYN
jgi:hypothetical protein